MKRFFRSDNLLSMTGVILGVALMQACSLKLPEETACGFVRNRDAQRVSWISNEPMKLYVDSSVPDEMLPSIQSAADKWNDVSGRTLIQVITGQNIGSATAKQDGVSKIYVLDEWDANRPDEQARTTIFWSGSMMTEADIRINNQDFDYFLGNYTTNSLHVHLESLVLHELGHALGLAHNESADSVMQMRLAQGDIRDEVGKEDLLSMSCEY